jgi:N-methylhydantoinase B
LEKPFGIFGGLDGHGARLTLNPDTKDQVEWPSKVSGQKVKSGDVIRVCGPASAGYGDPLLRDPNLVFNDVLDGIIDSETAKKTYGVVLKKNHLDIDATEAERNK